MRAVYESSIIFMLGIVIYRIGVFSECLQNLFFGWRTYLFYCHTMRPPLSGCSAVVAHAGEDIGGAIGGEHIDFFCV